MRMCLVRFFPFIVSLSLVQMHSASAGLNKFTQIDSFDNWVIEQKFDSQSKKISCRASMIGYGTWFGEKVRFDNNENIVYPKEISLKTLPSGALLEKLKMRLKKCRTGLMYLPSLEEF